MENGVEIIGTIITDVDRNAEKIVLPKYVEGTLWNMSLCNIKCIEVEDANVLRLFTGLPEKLIVKILTGLWLMRIFHPSGYEIY